MESSKGQSQSKIITAILILEVAFIILFGLYYSKFLAFKAISATAVMGLGLCYYMLYPIAAALERKQLSSKDLICFIVGFVSLGMMLSNPIANVLLRFIDRANADAVHTLLIARNTLSTVGYVLAFLTLFYNLYVWHRIGNQRPVAARLAFILWPRQMFFIGKIILLGIPL